MESNFLKIICNLGSNKISSYIKMPSSTFHVLKKEIELYLFEEREVPRCEIRLYWIDEDGDVIDIFNQCDYDVFVKKRPMRRILHVCSIDTVKSSSSGTINDCDLSDQAKIPPAAGSNDAAVHDRVECDACLMAPIVGFRYKCIQCDNYDLCENCESKHIHAEHMMVRMPTNNCPNVVEAHVTGRTTGRKHSSSKMSKIGCPYMKDGILYYTEIDEDAVVSKLGRNAEQSSPRNGKDCHRGRKYSRNYRKNFISHLYEMMNDLADGGYRASADNDMGKSSENSEATASNNGSQSAVITTSNFAGVEKEKSPINPAAVAYMANLAAQQARKTAMQATEMAAKVIQETNLEGAKSVAEDKAASATSSASSSADKVDATTSPCDPEYQPNFPTSLENFTKFLDPEFVKNGVQILNNFSDMFAKMLDDPPMDTPENKNMHDFENSPENCSISTMSSSSVPSNQNNVECDKKSNDGESVEKGQEHIKEKKEPNSAASSHVEMYDLGSDSDNESNSDSFVKLNAPKSKSVSKNSSAQTTPDESLNKSNAFDFVQLGADLKAHIAQESRKDSSTQICENIADEAKEDATTASAPISTTISTTPSNSTKISNSTTSNLAEQIRSIPPYHADQRINNAVLAMMAMGFSNEGAWLTQLLESVNGSIPDALDIMSVAQNNGSH